VTLGICVWESVGNSVDVSDGVGLAGDMELVDVKEGKLVCVEEGWIVGMSEEFIVFDGDIFIGERVVLCACGKGVTNGCIGLTVLQPTARKRVLTMSANIAIGFLDICYLLPASY